MKTIPNVSVQTSNKAPKKCTSIAYFVPESKKINVPADLGTPAIKKTIQNTIVKTGLFTGKKGETTVVHGEPYIKLMGLGKSKDITAQTIRQAAGDLARSWSTHKVKHGAIIVDASVSLTKKFAQALGEGLQMGGYVFDAHLSEKKKNTALASVTLCGAKAKATELKNSIQKGCTIGNGVNSARDLANTPANYLTPEKFVEKAKETFKGTSVKLEVIDKKKAEKLGMGGLIGVGKGSTEPPYMLILKYAPNKNQKPVCLVGKGVTFDSGGISIKPSSKMSEMKADMSGAAAVFGTMDIIAQMPEHSMYKENITGIIPLAENMPAGDALKPGDVITISNGKTVEILNTDAEGRLILADALSYAVKEGATEIIDLATLTGACLVALGTVAAGLFSNNTRMVNAFKKLPDQTGENLWQLPLYDEYKELLKSDVADIANCYEGRFAGASTAAMFLKEFVGKTPWVHLDIAPTMSNSKTSGADVKGMSGAGVRTLAEYLDSTT